MKVLIVDQDGVGLSFALRASTAGHTVRWFVKPKPSNSKDIGKGFKNIEKVDNWVAHAAWADLIFPTSNDDYVEKLEFFSRKGYPVFGPSKASAKLEISRKDGMQLLERAGIECAPYQTFPTMQAAEKHVMKTEERFVFKTLGDNEDKSLTYVSKSPADLVAWMRRTPPPKGEVMLQKFISGIEMGVSRFMGRSGWVGQYNESFEHKKLMPGNYGPNTGEMGTIAYFTPESKLGEQTLAKLTDELLKRNHRGDTALGFMIDDTGKPWPTEWTCRLGWPIANMMLGATKGDPVAWMRDALDGKDTTSFREDIGCCLVLAHGDFPYGNMDKEQVSGVPIYGITRGTAQHVHPQAVQLMPLPDTTADGKIRERPMWATAGDYVAVIDGFGNSVKQATKRAYSTVEKLHVANPIVRDDIGEKLKEQLPALHAHGYATHCVYDAPK
jgi:phosphoribosylamine--glycine ligase